LEKTQRLQWVGYGQIVADPIWQRPAKSRRSALRCKGAVWPVHVGENGRELGGIERRREAEYFLILRLWTKGFVMDRRMFIALLGSAAIAQLARAQQAKVYRIGLIHEGGPSYAVVEGLRDGLREFGFEEGKQYVIENHDLKGDRNAAAEAARKPRTRASRPHMVFRHLGHYTGETGYDQRPDRVRRR
jgi:hypothetical protein